MKKVIVSILVIIMLLANVTQCVYARTPEEAGIDRPNEENDDSWVKRAFDAAKDFMNDTEVENELDVVEPMFNRFKSLVKTVNVVLMVLLMGLSIIALSVTGVRYIASGASPNQREIAKQSLHTIFIGMAIGFGAYVIWRIAMSIVEIIIDALA